MHEAEPPPVYHPHVASRMPGRLRLRFHQARQRPELLHRLQTALEARPEVRAVAANPAAASLTLTYDAQRYSEASLLAVLADLDVLVAAATGAPHLEAPGGPSHAAVTVAEALDDLDRRVLALTGHTLGLRVLFPFGLAGLGIVLTVENGLGLSMLPGWLPLWLAFDAFVKLYPRPSR